MNFALDPNVEPDGTGRVGEFRSTPAELVQVFGNPTQGDDYKVSGMYIFLGDDGSVFTLYDWQCTSLCRGTSDGAPTPDEFWRSSVDTDFSIGGTENPKELIDWLKKALAGEVQVENRQSIIRL